MSKEHFALKMTRLLIQYGCHRFQLRKPISGGFSVNVQKIALNKHSHAVSCSYFLSLCFLFIFMQFWKCSHGAENYLKTVINKEVFKIKKFSKVCVQATFAEMTFLPRDFLQKGLFFRFYYNYLQIAFVYVACNICIFTAKIRFVFGVNEANTKQKTPECLIWLYDVFL